MKSVVVIGGGLAGLAAAVGLVRKGGRITLLESRPRLGGRASSFIDRGTGELIDNCQHVAMGCCTSFQAFCRMTGIAEAFTTEKSLYFVGPQGSISEFSATNRPAPFHLAAAFLRLPYLGWKDRLALVRGLRALARYRRTTAEKRSFADWLKDHRQTTAAIDGFWSVVLVSALSETLDRIEIQHARKVFVDCFLANRLGWQVVIPRRPLEELYGASIAQHLRQQGVDLQLQSAVERLVLKEGRVAEAVLRDGRKVAGDEFVLAVPHAAVAPLLPAGLIDHPELTRLQQIESAPISSVHLWFDRPIMPLPHAVLVGRLSQWIFRRDADADRSSQGHYYQVVISASRNLAGIPAEGVTALVMEELEGIWPETRKARIVHSRMVTEHRAVFSPAPGIEECRPPQQTPVPNLQLSGDWTRTGWPATMEGAVRSGFLAAENILARWGRPERLVAAPLPVEPISRLLFGLPAATFQQEL